MCIGCNSLLVLLGGASTLQGASYPTPCNNLFETRVSQPCHQHSVRHSSQSQSHLCKLLVQLVSSFSSISTPSSLEFSTVQVVVQHGGQPY
ncbi:hypothetical protein EV702DRAFT_1107663 [Suillus placidus]|uniref:Secreted protein n=1 Tax=Suillus placidus TaxID=48579 RepID=A0A9P7D1D4_9AGAM|nr:hypothetical protein EV702DRAFT_1107663 [Suillus placidus]